MQRVMPINGASPILTLVASCIALLSVCNVNRTVATTGFASPSLLRLSRRVWCGWGTKHKTILTIKLGLLEDLHFTDVDVVQREDALTRLLYILADTVRNPVIVTNAS